MELTTRMSSWRTLALALALLGRSASPAHAADEIDWGFRSPFRAYVYAGTGAPPITASAGASCAPNPDTTRGGCDPKIGIPTGVFGFTATDAEYTLPGGEGEITGQGTIVFSRPDHFFTFYLIDPSFSIAGSTVGVTARVRVESSFPSVPPTDVIVLLGTFPLSGPPAVGPTTVTWSTGAGSITSEAATALGGFLTAGATLDPVTIVLPYPTGVPLASKTVRLTDVPGKPEKRSLKVVVSGEPALSATAFAPVVDGAVLRVIGDTFENVYTLPASNWSALVKKSVVVGYRYDDPTRTLGPIASARLLDGKLRLGGKGSSLLHDLATEPVNLSLVLQSGAARYLCVGTGGTRKFKVGKSFQAAKNPPLASCPFFRAF